ncbi:hypothetical protein BT96DRAFT_936362 [Gymnopus androsaceus JB14]|uniref:Uncharacterized protein n=1 Tax=Gymnopus androsaceus JB14 TaxID=1447944 RepID=A0A6A4I2V8_9AGAR|nr:hypothetical protein BT96DRAFT_936362 [Gymnopus androsaceus JB14]
MIVGNIAMHHILKLRFSLAQFQINSIASIHGIIAFRSHKLFLFARFFTEVDLVVNYKNKINLQGQLMRAFSRFEKRIYIPLLVADACSSSTPVALPVNCISLKKADNTNGS